MIYISIFDFHYRPNIKLKYFYSIILNAVKLETQQQSVKSNQINSTQMSNNVTDVAPPTTTETSKDHPEGLSFEVRERAYDPDCDHVYTPGSPVSPYSPVCDETETPSLIRSNSAAITDPVASAASESQSQDPPKDPNIRRLQLGDNSETVELLYLLHSQGINTTKLVTQHIMKYRSLVRIAQTDDGKIIGCVIFDNEIDQEQLREMATYSQPEEVKQFFDAKPFIFLQLLIVAPEHDSDSSNRWKQRLVESFKACVVKNGKIAIIRGQADNQEEIANYKSCGFITMEDMGIPSYSSSKDNIEIMAYSPLGHEGTTEIFKNFYEKGARF